MKQREIKFRAWDKVAKEMIDTIWLDGDGVQSGVTLSLNSFLASLAFSDLILLQFTGSRDVNKDEICEGDILRHDINEEADLGFGLGIELSPVVWVQSEQAIYQDDVVVSGWFLKTKVYDEGRDCKYLPIEEASKPEIVSHIYETDLTLMLKRLKK